MAQGDDKLAERKFKRKLRRAEKLARAEGILRGFEAGLGPDGVVIDCGAHYGLVTTAMARSGATVYAFEPDPHSFGVLSGNCEGMDNVILHQAAVAPEKGQITLYRAKRFEHDPDVGSTASSIIERDTGAGEGSKIEIEAIDFVEFLSGVIAKHGRINFLKMDIEGAEVALLERLLETDLLTHVNFTAVETHRWMFPEMKARYDHLYKVAGDRPDLNLYLHWI